MNFDNLKRLRKYLESKDIEVFSVWNEEVLGVKVIKIIVESCQNVNEGNLAHVLHIPKSAVHEVTGKIFYVRTTSLCKHINHDGVLEFEKPFDLMDYEFKKQFSTLNPIRCQLRKNGITVDTVDIWEDYLMIKSDCSFGTLDSQHIRKALNIGKKTAVHCVEAQKCYAVERWK